MARISSSRMSGQDLPSRSSEATSLALPQPPRVDPESKQQDLEVLGPSLADHTDRHPARSALHRDVAISLEDTAQIGGDDLVRSRPQPAGHAQIVLARRQTPCLDERSQYLAVEADAATDHALVGGLEGADVLVHVGEDDLELALDPVVLVLVHRHELDSERGVGPGPVLADEAVRLQP